MGFNSRANLHNMNNFKMFNTITIPSSAWTTSTTIDGYGYQADITLEGITNDYMVDAVFNPASAIALGGAFTQPNGTNGSVRVFAVNKPSVNTLIVMALCYKKSN